jgi:hypothetical protein
MGYLLPGGNNYRNLVFQVGAVSNLNQQENRLHPRGTWDKRNTALARPSNDRKLHSNLSSERAPHIKKVATESNENLVMGPDGCLTARPTGRQTVGRNITLTSILTWVSLSAEVRWWVSRGGQSSWVCQVLELTSVQICRGSRAAVESRLAQLGNSCKVVGRGHWCRHNRLTASSVS